MKEKKPAQKGKSRFLGTNKTIRKDKRGIPKKDTKAGLSEKDTAPKQNQGKRKQVQREQVLLEKPSSPKNQGGVYAKNPYLTKGAGDSSGSKAKNPEAKPKSSVSHHDKFFKKAFSEPALAKVLAKVILYKEELKVCDLKSLKVEEKQAKANKMDLILTLGLKDFPKEQIHILILVEHKSQYSKKFWQQFLEYQASLLVEATKPFVLIPAVFYHGRSRWKHKISFQQAFLGKFFEKIPDSFKKSMLNWHARFIDTKAIEDERLRKWLENPKSKAGWVFQTLDKIWVLRHDLKVLSWLSFGIFRFFKKRPELISFENYFDSAGVSNKEWKKIKKEARQKGLLKKGGLMGGFMDTEKEILKRGMQQGWQERNYEVVSNMLNKKLDISLISEITGVSIKEIKKLTKNGS